MTFSFSKTEVNNGVTRVISMWSPEVTGDWVADCEKGREYAKEVTDEIRQQKNVNLLVWVVRGFGQDPSRLGVETGFTTALAEYLLAP